MTAVWWLSRHSLFLASSDSALGASVHHAPGLDGNRTEMGEGGGGVGRQAAHGVPCDLYHPDAAQGGGAGSSSALGLSVPATVVLLQRLVQTELAMLLRHLSSVCSNSPPEGVSATTAHGQHAGGAGKRSGFPREESEWRVGRVVCLAHAACCLAARSPRYHHTLYLFFKVTPVVLPACLHACMPACLHACMPACLHACMPGARPRRRTDGRAQHLAASITHQHRTLLLRLLGSQRLLHAVGGCMEWSWLTRGVCGGQAYAKLLAACPPPAAGYSSAFPLLLPSTLSTSKSACTRTH